MSKASHSPLGQWRGKTGGQVYRVRNGAQIISVYQPSVANPKSDAQLLQRTRFNLMAKLNALFDARLLNGFSSSKGVARAMFSKKLMPKIYAQDLQGPDQKVFRANIAPENIIFGPGKENFIKSGVTITSYIQLSAAGTVARLTFTTLPNLFNVDTAVARIRFVDVYGESAFQYNEVKVNAIDGEVIDSVASTLDFAGVGVHRVYMQVLAPSNQNLGNFSGNELANDPSGNFDVVADSGADYSASLTVGGSYYLGAVDVTA